jgi:RNA polymerase sigma factor (sigma-70 family)
VAFLVDRGGQRAGNHMTTQPPRLDSTTVKLPQTMHTTTAGQQVVDRLLTDLDLAFKRLVAHHARLTDVDAHDLYQEAVMRILRQRDVNPEHDALMGWLHQCLHYTAIDLKRKASRDKAEPSADVPEGIAADANPEQLTLRRELVERTGGLLRTLTPRQRDILVMRIVLGLSAQETADALSTTPDAVRIAQHRALSRLRRTVQGTSSSPNR